MMASFSFTRLFLLFGALFLLPSLVSADDLCTWLDNSNIGCAEAPFDVLPVILSETSTGGKILLIFLKIMQFLLYIVGVGAVVMLVWSGIRFVYSLGNEEQVEGAKRTLYFVIFGLLAVFLSLLVVQNVTNMLFYGGSNDVSEIGEDL